MGERRPGAPVEVLVGLARRAADPQGDPRHAVLDITGELRALEPASAAWPPVLREEFAEILGELDEVQPQFPSHRRTSALFDRQGMGQPGRRRAERLAGRLVSLSRSVSRSQR